MYNIIFESSDGTKRECSCSKYFDAIELFHVLTIKFAHVYLYNGKLLNEYHVD
jgi:hypothetical protein